MTPILEGNEIVGFVKILRDRTQQRETEEAVREERWALEVLNRAGSALAAETDLHRLVQIVTDAGVELTRAQFGAFFYNVKDERAESYMLYTLSGAPAEAFSKFPMPRNTEVFAPTFNGEGIVRSDDITKDPRYGRNAPRKGMPEGHLPVRSYLAVPVVARDGKFLGGLFFGHASPGVFTERSERGGHIKIYSEVGQGTSIKIYLPRLERPDEERDVPSSLPVPEGNANETILVVEDDHAVRAYSADALRDLGYRVIEASDGPSALRLLEMNTTVDLLFTDVVLPGGMPGAQVAAQARELRPDLKVLFTTGYARNAIFHHGRLDKGVQLITKPFSFNDLAAKVRDVLDGLARGQ